MMDFLIRRSIIIFLLLFCTNISLIAMLRQLDASAQNKLTFLDLPQDMHAHILSLCIPSVHNEIFIKGYVQLRKAESAIERIRVINKDFCDLFHPRNFDQLGITPPVEANILIHNAVFSHAPLFITYALIKGANIDKFNENGKTPLLAAAETNNYVSCVLLLKKGANSNAHKQTQQCSSPNCSLFCLAWQSPHTSLEYAIQNKNIPIIKLLIQHGALFSFPKPHRNTLLRSVKRRSPAIIKLLLNHHTYTQNELDEALEYVDNKGKSLNNIGKILLKAEAQKKI